MPQTGRYYQRWVMWRISTKCIHRREQFLILESRFPADVERRHIADGAARFASRWLSGSGYGRLGAKGVCHGIVAYPLNTPLVGSHELGAYHKSWVGYLCTCARAHRASVSQKRLDRLCSNLVCGLGVTKYVLSTSQGWGGASLHMRTCTPISVSQDPSGQLR